MEKTINIFMSKDKSILISVDGDLKHTIDENNRSISAEKIYEIIQFDISSKYKVLSENEHNIDTQVLDFFVELFAEIINKVNAIKVDSN